MAVIQTTTTTTPAPISFRWLNGTDCLLGLWLFLSPWVVVFGGQYASASASASAAAWNAWILGALIFVLSLFDIVSRQAWQGWIRGALGIWVFIAPWVLGFTNLPGAAWDHWLTGAVIVLISAGLTAATKPIQTPPASGSRIGMP